MLANIAVALAVIGLGMFPALAATAILDSLIVENLGEQSLVTLIAPARTTAPSSPY